MPKGQRSAIFDRRPPSHQVQHLGRTAKDIAAEIGEDLLKVKQKLAHGEFKPWVSENCAFSYNSAKDYVRMCRAKRQRAVDFERCNSIRDVLALEKAAKAAPKPAPAERRAATLNDLRKVERLRAHEHMKVSSYKFNQRVKSDGVVSRWLYSAPKGKRGARSLFRPLRLHAHAPSKNTERFIFRLLRL